MRDTKLLVAVLSVLGFFGGAAFAEDEGEIGFELTADFFSKYVWRGQNLVDDWVFQPGVSATYGGLHASFWGNLDLTDENGSNGEFSEIDLTLDYSGQFPGVDILGYSIGMINYDFPVNGAADDTTELYAGISLDAPASPSVTFYHDVDEAKDGTYISVGVGHSFEKVFELGPDTPVGVDIGATLGWGNTAYNKFYWGATPNGSTIGGEMNDLVLSVAFPFELAGLSFTASANYVTLLGDDIRKTDAYGKGKDDNLIAGIGFSAGF
jgi:hypothetical protein